MNRWLALLLLPLACDPGTKPSPESAAEAKAEPSPEANPEGTAEDPAPIEAEWVIWFQPEDGPPRSRWYTKTAAGVTRTAERAAVVIGQGEAWWQVRRADAEADVYACPCIESEDDPHCEKTGEITTLGLEAVPMGGGDPHALETASTEAIYGEVDGLGLSLRGGVGTRLFVQTSDGGYYCGAHGSYGAAIHVRDPSTKVSGWPALTLPEPMLKQAAVSEGMLEDYVECWNEGEVGMQTFIRDIMKVVSVEVSLEAGMLKLRWNTEADGPYVCTSDYAFDGWVESGLLPSAEPLGLAPPLPEGLQDALSDVGTAEAVGWGAVDPKARDTALAWFRALPEPPWPSERSTQRAPSAHSEAPKAALSRRKLLEEGRTRTRAGEYAEAVKVLTEAIEADPSAPRPYAARCYAQLLAESYRAARADCEKVLTMQPDDRFAASVHYNLGLIAQGQGRAREAKAAFERSLRLRENATVRRALQALQSEE